MQYECTNKTNSIIMIMPRYTIVLDEYQHQKERERITYFLPTVYYYLSTLTSRSKAVIVSLLGTSISIILIYETKNMKD